MIAMSGTNRVLTRAKVKGICKMDIKELENKIINYKTIQVDKKQVRLHRFIMEQKLGRKLGKNECVHHIDGNKLNNSIDNLEVCTREEHLKKHYEQIGGKDNQFKKVYCLPEKEIKELYQDVNMTHQKLANIYGCSTGTIFNILGKNARKRVFCKVCGKPAKYIKQQLCSRCYGKEYRKNVKHK